MLSCDASVYGAGAVLSHFIDRQYRPISFASVTLTDTQKNYSLLDKEAFSIIFRLKKFHQFLSGRSFKIINHHKRLLRLFDPYQQTPLHVSARLQRWKLMLSSYDYKIVYRSTHDHLDADGMSRVLLPKSWSPVSDNITCYFIEEDVVTNVTHELIKKYTQTDPVLSNVVRYSMSGWPSIVDPSLIPFKSRRDELCIEQGCVLWGTRVVIPASLQKMVLQELHHTHPGMTRMKMLASSYVWSSWLDASIEETVRACSVCKELWNEPPKPQVHPCFSLYVHGTTST